MVLQRPGVPRPERTSGWTRRGVIGCSPFEFRSNQKMFLRNTDADRRSCWPPKGGSTCPGGARAEQAGRRRGPIAPRQLKISVRQHFVSITKPQTAKGCFHFRFKLVLFTPNLVLKVSRSDVFLVRLPLTKKGKPCCLLSLFMPAVGSQTFSPLLARVASTRQPERSSGDLVKAIRGPTKERRTAPAAGRPWHSNCSSIENCTYHCRVFTTLQYRSMVVLRTAIVSTQLLCVKQSLVLR